ncbi:SusC/RagA family TonB-linked outer membrane protein [Bacteroides togonis]|uniref:SusC/RagA family TonB-linked outer membrane protein n=1 Tax=Bacteroides togonis TaxID=1917883 RepID=UPI0021CD1B1D|nr:SusC/RagA family TonB-linked outer membrane protein [Bacteroides togonis]
MHSYHIQKSGEASWSSAKTLVISYIGMETQTVTIKSNLKIVLRTNSEMLDEVMVVAFGTAKKSAFTGSAAVIDNKELSKRITTNVSDALVGSVPGLQIRGTSGAPGSDSNKINIRGIASMYANTEPLIIVDGAPYTASLTNIPQNDIESITVLKDAASAALYGARGAAGVIIVTTKKGQTKEAEVNVDMKWGVNSRAVQDYDVITDPGEYYEAYYAQLYNYSFFGQGNTPSVANAWANQTMLSQLGYNVYTVPNGEMLIGMDGRLNPNATLGRRFTNNGTEYYLTPDDWQDLAYRNSLRQEYTVSVNGGNDRSSFYASIGYLNDEGIIINSDYERLTARVRADYQVKKWLKLGANVGFVHSIQHSIPNGGTDANGSNMMYYTSSIAPIYPAFVRVVDSNGNVVIQQDEQGHNAYDFGTGNQGYGLNRPFMSTTNPLANNQYDVVENGGNQMNGTFTADINITSYLKANITSTVNWGQTNYFSYMNPYYGSKVSVNGELTKQSTSSLRTNNIQTLNYFKDFGSHSVSVLAGHEYYKTTTQYLGALAQGGFSPEITEIDAFAKISDASSNKSQYNVEGYFASAQYDYDDKYFASVSYRRDASSYFAPENRWGNFWSVGGAWMLNKESFMENTSDWLNELKIKLSVGQQGNDNIGAFAYTDLYTLAPTGDFSMGATFMRMGNPDITWETTTNYNLGVEFALWDSRLTGNVDYYVKKTTDLLFWLSIPESSGTRGYYGNIGDIRNMGLEVSLTGAIIRNRNVDWTVTANLSHNQTKILSLPESKTRAMGGFNETNSTGLGGNWYEVGGPLYNAYCIEYAGVNDKGEALYWVDDEVTIAGAPGKNHSYTTTDPNGATYYKQGSILPKVFGGFNTTLRIGGFDATVAFDYQIGGKIQDYRYASLMTPRETGNGAGSAIHKDYIKSWSPNNTSSNIPRWQYGDRYTVFASSSRFLTNASYLNFQSFTVGYTLPKKWSNFVSKIRVYAAGENLCFWSARKGLDPRYSYDGNSSITPYSPARNISGGIQLTF